MTGMNEIRIFAVLMGSLEAAITILFLQNCLGLKVHNKKLGLSAGVILCWIGFGFFYDNFMAFAIFWLVVMTAYCRITMNGTVIFHEGITAGIILLNLLLRVGSSLCVKSISGAAWQEHRNGLLNTVLLFYLQSVMYIAVLCILMTLIHKNYKTTRMERYCSVAYGMGNVLLIWLFLIWGKSGVTDVSGLGYAGWIMLSVQVLSLLLLGAVFEVKKMIRYCWKIRF